MQHLPRHPSTLDVFIVRTQNGRDPSTFKDLKVGKRRVFNAPDFACGSTYVACGALKTSDFSKGLNITPSSTNGRR